MYSKDDEPELAGYGQRQGVLRGGREGHMKIRTWSPKCFYGAAYLVYLILCQSLSFLTVGVVQECAFCSRLRICTVGAYCRRIRRRILTWSSSRPSRYGNHSLSFSVMHSSLSQSCPSLSRNLAPSELIKYAYMHGLQ